MMKTPVLALLLLAGLAGAPPKVRVEPVEPAAWRARAADLRLAAADTLPETESVQQVIFSATVSGTPEPGGAIERITAPPWTAILNQHLKVRAADGAEPKVLAGPGFTWEPGAGTALTVTDQFRLSVQSVALNHPQGFLLRVEVTNTGNRERSFEIASVQEPRIARPARWNYGLSFRGAVAAPVVSARDGAVTHAADPGAVAFGMAGPGVTVENGGNGSRLARTLAVPAAGSAAVYVALALAADAPAAGRAISGLMEDPGGADARARSEMDAALADLSRRLPAFSHPDARLVRFYRHAALQLLYDRWRLGNTFVLDPWYPTGGRDSGCMDAYAWDLGYSAVAMSILDPTALRAILVALLRAPLTEHFSIEPLTGTGNGPFYAYSPFAYTWAVDQYVRATGDRAILKEVSAGKTVLEWLVTLARWGESDRDPDGNGLLDFGNDRNLLELKKTGSGPGYVHEVPSPNGERAFVYEAVAAMLEAEGGGEREATARDFRRRAQQVREALNRVLWLEPEGWYGSRQADGSVAPVYSIQIFDLLRFSGVVPEDRARRLVAHLNDEEFLGPWGVRSMSRRDRLFDYNDHDWAGPMTYIGDPAQLAADLLGRGYIKEARAAWQRVLWWPEHLAVLPQGIGNEDYTFRFPAAARFGGRIAAGRTNMISGVVGVEAVIRGLFGIERQADGAIRFSSRRLPGEGPSSLSFPFRGRTWLVTQREEGIYAGLPGGIEASLFRQDGSLEFRISGESVRIRTTARGTGPARLAIPLGPVARHFGKPAVRDLQVRWNGRDTAGKIRGSSLVVTIPDAREPAEFTMAPRVR